MTGSLCCYTPRQCQSWIDRVHGHVRVMVVTRKHCLDWNMQTEQKRLKRDRAEQLKWDRTKKKEDSIYYRSIWRPAIVTFRKVITSQSLTSRQEMVSRSRTLCVGHWRKQSKAMRRGHVKIESETFCDSPSASQLIRWQWQQFILFSVFVFERIGSTL